jgi:hypothetical protein
MSSRRKSQNPHSSKLEPLAKKAVSDYEQIAALVTKSTRASEKKSSTHNEVSLINDALTVRSEGRLQYERAVWARVQVLNAGWQQKC